MDGTENTDASTLAFDEFVRFFFQRPANREYWYQDPEFADGNLKWSRPSVVIDYATRLFREFGAIGRNYFLSQIDHGIWALLADGSPLSIQEFLWNSSISLEKRDACIRAMSHVYSDFVAGSEEEEMVNCFYMWWDVLGDGFWSTAGLTRNKAASLLTQDQKRLLDAMFDTLKQILEVPDQRVQQYALHGFGHLHHEGVPAVVQSFIDQHRGQLTDDALKWVEQCRDGTVM